MPNPQYKRPPITEAIIEIRLEDALSRKPVEKIHDRLKESFEFSEKMSAVEFEIDAQKKKIVRLPDESLGFRLTSKDQADIIFIKPNAMLCSRLAPYNGWENFEARARENWEVWTKIVKHRKIQRIGVRYINRIDIPVRKGQITNIEDYLTVFPKYPEPHLLKSFVKYTMQIAGPFSVDGFNLIINTNVVNSPLIDHVSIVLDLDFSPQGDMPQRNDKIWELINQMREHKNNAFEMCISDKTRELFV